MVLHPRASVSVCYALVACGNWARAQGELTVCTNTGVGVGWMEREVKERKRRGKLDPKTGNCLSFLEMQNQAYADVSIKA